VTVHAAGRTDAGVHAVGQVASVTTRATHDTQTLRRALNAVLPVDVRVVAVDEAAPGFHARFDAISKTYEYRIVNAPYVSAFDHRYVWHVPENLDVDAMREGAAALRGTHDFAAFQASGGDVSTTERTILAIDIVDTLLGQSAVTVPIECPRLVVVRVEGDGFLRHMVRTIAGTLVDVGLRRWRPAHIAQILAGRDRTKAGRAAPPQGLFLIRVKYADAPSW
jgi:tRNA pseudouridine38-40 synthase